MNEIEIKEKIHKVYFEVFEQHIDNNINFFYQFGDSVYHMTFATNLQNEFSIQFTMEEYESHPTINLLTCLVSDKLKVTDV